MTVKYNPKDTWSRTKGMQIRSRTGIWSFVLRNNKVFCVIINDYGSGDVFYRLYRWIPNRVSGRGYTKTSATGKYSLNTVLEKLSYTDELYIEPMMDSEIPIPVWKALGYDVLTIHPKSR